MKLIFTKPFIRDYQNLPAFIQTRADKQLELLLNDPNHLLYAPKRLKKKKDYEKEELQKGFVFLFRLSPWTKKMVVGQFEK